MHLTVPVTSFSAFPSRPTLTFCDFYVTQYCCDFANSECSIGTFATQREARKVYIGIFLYGIHCIQPQFERDMRKIHGWKSSQTEATVFTLMDMSHMC